MPLGNWFRDDWQLTRNHYAWIVHLIFGLLITFPLWEFAVACPAPHESTIRTYLECVTPINGAGLANRGQRALIGTR
jgi:hypothetical protein